METLIYDLNELFWSPRFWLPTGVTWNNLESSDEMQLPIIRNFVLDGLILAFMMIAIQYLIFHPVYAMISKFLFGFKIERSPKPKHEWLLETIYQSYQTAHKPIPDLLIQSLAKGVHWSEWKVQKWFKARKLFDKPTQVEKLSEICWQLTYHVVFTLYGTVVLHDKIWLSDITQCWMNYPKHPLLSDVNNYYLAGFSFYMSSTLTFLYQSKRKDSLQMLLHHLVTLLLIMFSYSINFIRIGTLVLLIHECGDIPLLIAKIFVILKKKWLTDVIFVIFVITWIITRIIIYPLWILRSSIFDSYLVGYQKTDLGYLFFNSLLLSLFVFHCIWTFYIVQVIRRKLKTSAIEDVRSDDEETEDIEPVELGESKKEN